MTRNGNFLLIISTLAAIACASSEQEYAVDEGITANEVEGLRLAEELEEILSSPNISDTDKAMINNGIERQKWKSERVVVPTRPPSRNQEDSGEDNSYGISASMSGSNSYYRDVIRGKDCCKVVIPPEWKRRATTVAYTCRQYYTHRYTVKCGWFGWLRCARYSTRYRSPVCYSRDYDWYQESRPCPQHLKVCCEGYFWFRDACVNIARLQALLDYITGMSDTEPSYYWTFY